MGQGDIVYMGGGGAAAGAGGIAARISGNTTGTTAMVSSGTLVLAGGTNITLSQNGNSITIVGANTGTLTQWYPAMQGGFTTRTMGNSTVHVDPVYVDAYVSASQANLMLFVSISTSSNSSHAGTLSYLLGVYTNNASTLSLASSGSVSYAWTNTNNVSTASLSNHKLISIPINLNMTPGNYWIGHLSATATANTNWVTVNNNLIGASTFNGLFCGAATGTFNQLVGQGHWSVQTASMPNSMAITDLRNNAPQDVMMQVITFMNATA
ncbi:MAG TPA: hypothetical protein VN903_35560 [Polyangia bacterium]|nr:hypothetical protein [Polyangia bacterium]